jgi:hypothetical protein
MQPDRNTTDWQQPTEQPSQAPYVPNPADISHQSPVVTLTPDAPTLENPIQPSTQPPAPIYIEQPAPSAPEQPEEDPVHWQASEYIHHERNALWFIVFAIVVLGLIAVAIFLIKSVTFAILVPVMAATLLVYTRRPPRVLDYTLSRQGLHINDRLYPFAEFKGFGVIRDGAEYSVMLLPIKRFKMGVSVYFPEEAGEAIVDMLGARLPMQELDLDLVDKIIRKLRI